MPNFIKSFIQGFIERKNNHQAEAPQENRVQKPHLKPTFVKKISNDVTRIIDETKGKTPSELGLNDKSIPTKGQQTPIETTYKNLGKTLFDLHAAPEKKALDIKIEEPVVAQQNQQQDNEWQQQVNDQLHINVQIGSSKQNFWYNVAAELLKKDASELQNYASQLAVKK